MSFNFTDAPCMPESDSNDSGIFRKDRPQANPHLQTRRGTIGEHSMQTRYIAIKSVFDQIVGIVLLVPAAPIIAVFWCLVRITSAGPGFYLQTRVGQHGQLFKIVKLRTMRCDAERPGKVQWCVKGDPRITPIGSILRKLHIDELPQLWNVACGEMSLVGPRPERPEITKSLERLIPGYQLRHAVKPGVTGLSQVNLEPDTNINITRCKQILDLRYIACANPWLDARMLFATMLRMIGIRGERAMRLTRLKQTISEGELAAIGYQFDTPEDQLWNPSHDQSQTASTPGTDVQPAVATTSLAFRPPAIERRPSFSVAPPKHLSGSVFTSSSIPNAFTVDVEDYYQVSAFENRVSRKQWDKYESRVEGNTDRLLKLLDQHSVQGTFFILGWVAERYPELVQRIHHAGHEVASHGYWHQLVYDQSPEDFATDLSDSVDAIYNACGVEVSAYRAPSFSITSRSLWALDILVQKGFTVDSSIFPIKGHDRYGMPGAKREIHRLETETGSIIEFPPSAWHLPGLNIPIGGGYFRIFPYSVSRRAMKQVRKTEHPAMFYIHPWEIDPKQPTIAGAGLKTRMRHYTGLHNTHARLDRMLRESSFTTMARVIQRSAPQLVLPSRAPVETTV
ncbi:XrtA system polysaccharide deacetylase [Aureliella helgolandensis]|uniref:Undecaprenyl-phosphate N-acetylgalactosaminyl 1-phosphate transferase n=1 Tax=Aureliella helgolandensis TaxID=2527968 RepID=A0A518GDY7_9BACT|nr:XrtA system polysaccharide deacetylase [Aureliella helgolandensis]QDV26811.1 Putative undecaprenyl-phosphate N-acetylgalactosaminyl 1-phosphate transferase [Aureliella helgolandensis]